VDAHQFDSMITEDFGTAGLPTAHPGMDTLHRVSCPTYTGIDVGLYSLGHLGTEMEWKMEDLEVDISWACW